MQHGTHSRRPAGAAGTWLAVTLLSAAAAMLPETVAAGAMPAAGTDQVATSRIIEARDETLTLVEQILEEMLEEVREDDGPRPVQGEGEDELIFPTVKFFIELNETDQDVGTQALIGGEPYRVLKAYRPDGKKILDLKPKRGLKEQGMSDFFFESAEPTLDEVSIEEFFSRFPQGTYEFESITIEGLEQEGETTFSHVMPAGPVITSPLEGDVVDPKNTIITWDPVTLSTALDPPQVPVTIVGYQVIVTREDPLRVYSVDVSAETTSVSVPPEFLDPGTEYELEILAVEATDNQTISLLFFETDG